MPKPASDPGVRRTGLGGSDAAAVAGQSPWAGPMDVWLEKTGQSAPLIETERMHWGTVLEDAVAREWSKRTGYRIRKSNLTMRAESAPWRMAHIDRAVVTGPDGIRRGLEVKTADVNAAKEYGEEDTDEVPVHYLLQCQHYLAVTGWDVWHLAVLIGGNSFRKFLIPRDEALIANLVLIEDAFWQNNVLAKDPPPIDGTEGSRRFLESRHTSPEAVVEMTDTCYRLALEYGALMRSMKDAEARKGALANQIREQMGSAGKSRLDNVSVSWGVSKVKRLDYSALAAAHPDIAAPFYKESEEHRLTVSVKEATA